LRCLVFFKTGTLPGRRLGRHGGLVRKTRRPRVTLGEGRENAWVFRYWRRLWVASSVSSFRDDGDEFVSSTLMDSQRVAERDV
jgi:hypothetical protein